ncbi:DUF3747 domain-containing protein [Synechococcus sp. CCY 9618]|uniref:DUF3747 domain-containing protein n=1 Tax=Synechococcus sp. CCY 9618 TaxID=2815602 RepID=UPI001C22FD08
MNAVILPVLPRGGLATLVGVATALTVASPASVRASALFAAAEVDQQSFLLVAAPIGTSGERSQLNIYEQLKPIRPCFEVGQGQPAYVNPLLATFDFTGICSRYIDANGYSLRVGGQDLASSYRLMVTRSAGDMLLLAFPTKAGAGPEMVVARTRGSAPGFLKFELEPGWRLMRRQFGGRNLGHLYVYTDSWPGTAATAAQPAPAVPVPAPGASPSLQPAAANPIKATPGKVKSGKVKSVKAAPAQPPSEQEAPTAAQRPLPPPSLPATKL